MQFLKNSHYKISPIQFKIESLSENNLNQLLINYLKTSESGFSLIGLLVILFLIGILAAIALPNLLNQNQTDPIACGGNSFSQVVGTINRAQQSYHFEHNKFSSNLTDLGIVIPESKYYNFSKVVTDKAAYAWAIPKDTKKDGQRSYSGAIFYLPKEKEYLQGVCEGNEIDTKPNKPILKNGEFICSESMTLIY